MLGWRQYGWIAGAVVLVSAGLHWLGPVLTPFLIGAIFAYLCTPLVERAERRGVPRALGTLAGVLMVSVLTAALFLVLIPLVNAEIVLLSQRLPVLATLFNERVVPWVQEHLGVTLALDLETLRAYMAEAQRWQQLSRSVLAGVKTGGLFVLSLFVNLALVPVVMFYLLRDWNSILVRVDDLLPRGWRDKVRTIAAEIDGVLAEFLYGQALVMIVLAVYYATGLSLAGLDRALSIGILTGVLVFIPYVGFGLGLVLATVAALLQWAGWPGFLAVLAVYGVGQLLENYVLIPRLIGGRIGLHPLAVIFALLAFGQLFGFVGVLLALPVSAAVLVGLRHLRAAYVASPIYRGH